jgi:hypothetical protein
VQLAGLQAAIDYCAKVDPQNSSRFEKAVLSMLPDMTASRIAAARRTAQFGQTYAAIGAVLKGLAPSDGVRLCAAAVRDDDHERRNDRDPTKGKRR